MGGEGHPFLQYPPKASIWVPNIMRKHAAENSAPSPKVCVLFTFFVFQQMSKAKGKTGGNQEKIPEAGPIAAYTTRPLCSFNSYSSIPTLQFLLSLVV